MKPGKSRAANTQFSSFCAKARLKGSLSRAKELLDMFPGSTRISDGTRTRYAVTGSNPITHFILEVASDAIRFDYYCEKMGKKAKHAGLARFLSVLAYLSDIYEIELATLYSDLIDAAESSSFIADAGACAPPKDEKAVELAKSNYSLSIALVRIGSQNERLEKENKACIRAIRSVLERFSNGEDATAILAKFGVDEATSKEIAEFLEKEEASRVEA